MDQEMAWGLDWLVWVWMDIRDRKRFVQKCAAGWRSWCAPRVDDCLALMGLLHNFSGVFDTGGYFVYRFVDDDCALLFYLLSMRLD
jgi:hypothetical protein